MITIHKLKVLKNYLKINQICNECNINYNTITSKMARNTELSITESQKLTDFTKQLLNI